MTEIIAAVVGGLIVLAGQVAAGRVARRSDAEAWQRDVGERQWQEAAVAVAALVEQSAALRTHCWEVAELASNEEDPRVAYGYDRRALELAAARVRVFATPTVGDAAEAVTVAALEAVKAAGSSIVVRRFQRGDAPVEPRDVIETFEKFTSSIEALVDAERAVISELARVRPGTEQ